MANKKTKKKIVFMGEKPLGQECLKILLKHPHADLIGICTRKVDNVWWGKQYVRQLAQEFNIPILTRRKILEYDVDILISVLYPFIIEEDIINHAQQCAVNLHQAPLPEYRGCNSTSHAIINGESTFGCTLHILEKELDTGPIIEKRYIDILTNETAGELYNRINNLCLSVFIDRIDDVISGNFSSEPQDTSISSHSYSRSSLANKELSFDWDDDMLWNFVRGMEFSPFEPAYIKIQGNRKIYLTTKAPMK